MELSHSSSSIRTHSLDLTRSLLDGATTITIEKRGGGDNLIKLHPSSSSSSLTSSERIEIIITTLIGFALTTGSGFLLGHWRHLVRKARCVGKLPTFTIKQLAALLLTASAAAAPPPPVIITSPSTTTTPPSQTSTISGGLLPTIDRQGSPSSSSSSPAADQLFQQRSDGKTVISCFLTGMAATEYENITHTKDGKQPAVVGMCQTTELYETSSSSSTRSRCLGTQIPYGPDLIKVIDFTDGRYLDEYTLLFKRTHDPVFAKLCHQKNKKSKSHPSKTQILSKPEDTDGGNVISMNGDEDGLGEGHVEDDSDDGDDTPNPRPTHPFPTPNLSLDRSLLPDSIFKMYNCETRFSGGGGGGVSLVNNNSHCGNGGSVISSCSSSFISTPNHIPIGVEHLESYLPLKQPISIIGDIYYDQEELTLKVIGFKGGGEVTDAKDGNGFVIDYDDFEPIVTGMMSKDWIQKDLQQSANSYAIMGSILGIAGLSALLAPGLLFWYGNETWCGGGMINDQ